MADKNVSIQIASLPTLLGVAFIVLKLCGVIHWSWWLVTLPLWAGLALAAAIVAVILAVVGILAIVYAVSKRLSGE